MKRSILMVMALAGTWLLWSGNFKLLLLELGALSVLITLLLIARMQLLRREFFALDLIPGMLLYWVWLLKEIVRANLRVTRIVLDPSLPISPTLVTVTNPCAGPIGQATLANSITLTPGTLTVDAHEGEFRIHCLTRTDAKALASDEMGQRVLKAVRSL